MFRYAINFSRSSWPVLLSIFVFTLISVSCDSETKYPIQVPDEINIYKIKIVSGNNQTGPTGSPLSAPLRVFVSDENGVKVPQWQVEFKVVEGEGTLGPVKVDTDQEGYAESTLTPTGMPGTVKVEASPYLSAEKVTFTATTTD